MSEDNFNFDMISVLKKHGKTIWDGLHLLASLVKDEEISFRQSSEILSCIVEKPMGSLANALKRAIEQERTYVLGCTHQKTRWLWYEPKEAQDAFEMWAEDNGIDVDNVEQAIEFYHEYNILICISCGKEMDTIE